MNLSLYISNIDRRYRLGNATEHTFRGDLQQLLESLVPNIRATNEPKRQSCGAPDYILTHKDVPVGFIEAKDIGDGDLNGVKKTGNKEQFDRYKASLNNIIFTDYIHFHLYRDGEFVTKIAIGELTDKGIKPLPENFNAFEGFIRDFCAHQGQTIKSPKRLAELMAGKARLLANIIEMALTSDENNQEDSSLRDQMTAFKEILIHDITPKGFADVYAQTIAYGMFAARLHDATLETFSRQEAAELIPKSNPFLRKLFQYIAGYDLDDRIKWIVDDLVQIFLACNVEQMLKNYGKSTKMEDPIIHFYEDFLSEYDPKLRKARGVWYTPQPVVNFIVRAVDDILKTEFNLPQGLADTSKTTIKVEVQGKTVEQEVHKVQILDPATGTGTFLAETVKQIHKKFEGQQGIWNEYVEKHLIPRLNGFELLMASYAMAHLKLDLLLSETGFTQRTNQRFKVYLTNSLEEYNKDTGTLFANWLSAEANEANHIKRDTPVMCVIGNPPYAVSSTNKGEWIDNLIADYKKDLNEKSYNSLSDDYVKFIRFGQHFIEKNGSGVLAYISNNSFIDGIIFRQMRKHLLESFDKIFILDLHGNAKKKEVSPDGSPDQNVFDIMQGVSINLFVKTGKKKKSELGKVFQYDLQGKRDLKYDFLKNNSLKSLEWNNLDYSNPNYFFAKKDFKETKEYNIGFKVDELFSVGASGLTTERDNITIQFESSVLENLIENFKKLDEETLRNMYDKKPDGRDWKYSFAKKDILLHEGKIVEINYRPFDKRITYYTGKSKGFMAYPRNDVMFHFISKDNIGLVAKRGFDNFKSAYGFITKCISDRRGWSSPGMQGAESIFPLYLYKEEKNNDLFANRQARTPNLNAAIVQQIAEKLGLTFVPEKNSPPLEGCPSGGVVFSQSPTNSNANEILTTINNTPIYRNFVENLPHNPALKQLAKDKRKEGILSEVLFWKQVHKGVFHKIDFDRQRIIGNYIVDFYVKALGLIVEIDGSSHDNKQEYDAKRQAYLESFGLKVFRCSDIDVKKNINAVFTALEKFIINEFGEKTTPAFSHPSSGGELAPIDILDYIYAVLHSPSYREKYKEFLKIDFPRVPYPQDADTFWQLVKLGGEIRELHLLESPKVEQYITTYPIAGSNEITRSLTTKDIGFELTDEANKIGRVWINDAQYFDKVPQVAWEFYIGGYQPAQKWLKDRKNRKLEFDDILHYQKIIVALTETERLMREVDRVIGTDF